VKGQSDERIAKAVWSETGDRVRMYLDEPDRITSKGPHPPERGIDFETQGQNNHTHIAHTCPSWIGE
jgi:hypothetical protein